MTTWATVVISLALTACSSRTPTERERALAQLPPDARFVIAADGAALSTARSVVDAARPFLPARLGCVIDQALTSEAVAVAVQPRVGTSFVIVTRAHVAACPALSQIESDMYVATIGAGTPASEREASLLAAPRWARARPYLLRDPIAIAIERDGRRYVAVAQTSPVDAWLSIDASEVEDAERDVRGFLDAHRATGLANKLAVQTRQNQVLVSANKLELDDLALVTAEMIRAADAVGPSVVAPAFACPPPGDGITRCTDGTRYVVSSVRTTLRRLLAGDALPVVAGGDVVGIRLTKDAEVMLRRGDVILGLDAHRITSQAQFQELARHAGEHASLAVRRDGSDVLIELRQ